MLSTEKFQDIIEALTKLKKESYDVKQWDEGHKYRKRIYEVKMEYHSQRVEFYMDEYAKALSEGKKSDLKRIGTSLRKAMIELEKISLYD